MMATSDVGSGYLQQRIDREFALARHLGVIVDAANATTVVLRAPLAPNANYKGTAFGGSLFSVAVLAGWAWLTRCLEVHEVAADAVIQQTQMRYLKPVHGEMRACALAPSEAQCEKFFRMLARSGRGRLDLRVDTYYGQELAAVFDGVYVAAMR
jgi:thioesterase domain-containing protein